METSDDSSLELQEITLIKKAKLKKMRKCIRKRDKTINRLRQTVKRQKKCLHKIEDVPKQLRNQNLIGEDVENTLCQIIGPSKEVFSRYFNKTQGTKLTKTYNPEIRAFALNLNFMSPKAYSYVRDAFANCLPHPRTIKEWYKVYGCTPGFTREAFNAIELASQEAIKSGSRLYINLCFDEIHIRTHIDWDGNNSYGYVDMGDGGKGEIPANQILVLMAVCLNRSHFKFFFIFTAIRVYVATAV